MIQIPTLTTTAFFSLMLVVVRGAYEDVEQQPDSSEEFSEDSSEMPAFSVRRLRVTYTPTDTPEKCRAFHLPVVPKTWTLHWTRAKRYTADGAWTTQPWAAQVRLAWYKLKNNMPCKGSWFLIFTEDLVHELNYIGNPLGEHEWSQLSVTDGLKARITFEDLDALEQREREEYALRQLLDQECFGLPKQDSCGWISDTTRCPSLFSTWAELGVRSVKPPQPPQAAGAGVPDQPGHDGPEQEG